MRSYYFSHSFETLFRENRFRQHGYLSIGIDPRVLFFLSILLPSRGDRISYRRVGRVERKNGKHRMVGNVARWNVTHPGKERGRVWGGRINILGATPWVTDSSSLRIPARPATTCCAHFLGRALPPFTVPSAIPFSFSTFVTELESPSSFIYLFIFLLRTRIRKRKRERKFNFRMKEEALVLKIVPYRPGWKISFYRQLYKWIDRFFSYIEKKIYIYIYTSMIISISDISMIAIVISVF